MTRPYLLLSPSAEEEFAHLPKASDSDPYDSVIVGLHESSLSYINLNIAFRILKSEPISFSSTSKAKRKPILIAPHTSMFQQSPATDDLPAGLSLGIGPFVRALEVAGGWEAEIVGKPTRRFFEMAIERIKANHPDAGEIEPEDVGVVGDDVVNDLGEGTRDLCLKRILGMYICIQDNGANISAVRTGKYREGVEKTDHPADRVYDSFADFVHDLV